VRNDDDDDDDGLTANAEHQAQANPPAYRVTRSGRVSKPTVRFVEEIGMAELDAIMSEFQLVGAGIGGGFDHTSELSVMNFRQAMKTPDKDNWK